MYKFDSEKKLLLLLLIFVYLFKDANINTLNFLFQLALE